MPQGHRKVPFSGKAKKTQLLMKREKKEDGSSKVDANRRDKTDESKDEPKVPLDKGALLVDVQLHGKAAAHRYDLVTIF